MPVMARCGDCGKQFRIRDELAGKVLPCKNCGADFRVPRAGGGSAGGGSRPAQNRPAQGRPAAKPAPARRSPEQDLLEEEFAPSGGSGKLWIIGGAAIGTIIVGVAVAIFIFAGKDDGEEGDKKDNDNKVAKNDDDKNKLPDDNNPPNDNLPPNNNNNQNNNNNPPDNKVPDNGNGNPVANNDNGNGNGGIVPPPDNKKPVFGGNNNPPVGGGVKQPGGIVPPGQQKQAVFDKSVPVKWTMKADPPAEPIEYTNKGKLLLRSPKTTFANAIYPQDSNTVVALGSNFREKDYRDVYDLRSGQLIGKIGGIKLSFGKTFALSPTGHHFAAVSRDTNGIWLWDVQGKRQLGTLPLEEKHAKSGRLEILAFAGPERIVASARDTDLWVWSHPYDKPAKGIAMPKTWDFEKESVSFSRGGRYMTYYHKKDKDVVATDLTTGNEVGRIMIPKEVAGWGCKGIAYSHDGKEIAALYDSFDKKHLFVWDAATGKQLVQHRFETKRGHFKGPAVQWFADKKKWLIQGNYVVDREAGKPVWEIPKIKDAKDEARVLGNDRIALFGQPSGGAFVSTLAVPHDKIAKATKVVQSGGTTADVNLPELKKADWSAARVVVADGVAGGWKLTGAAAPAGAIPAGATNIDASFGKVTGVKLARRDAGIAVAHSESAAAGGRGRFPTRRGGRFGRAGNQPAQNPNAGPVNRLDIYNLKTRNRVDSLPLTYSTELMAVSPTGAHALVRYKTGEDRLDVWSLSAKKHVAGWKPYVDEKSKSHHKVTEAHFVDEEHVLTVNSNNRMALWKIPDCKAVYVINGVTKPQLSSSGKVLCVKNSKSLRFFNALTGEPVGDITPPSGIPTCGAFHPDGEKFAAAYSIAGGRKLGVWNLKTGNLESEFPIPLTAGLRSIHWCGDSHVLLDNAKLVDLKNKMLVWTYSLPGGTHINETPDGKHWYLSGTRPMSLTGLAMPDNAVTRATAGKKLEPQLVLKPGMEVAINVQLNGINGGGNLNQEVYNAWKQRLEAAGVKVVQKAPLVLFGRADVQNTGRTETFTISSGNRFGFMPPPRFGGRFGRGGGAANNGANTRTETVTDSVINCRIVFGKGQQAFGEIKRPINKLPRSVRFYRTSIKKGETADSHFSNRQQRYATSFFKSYHPPAYLFDKQAANGLGSSQLVSGGSR